MTLIQSEHVADSVKLDLPVAPAYRPLALDLARKYVESAGGSSADADATSQALAAALDKTTRAANPDANVQLTFSRGAAEVQLQITCGGTTATITQPCVFSTR